MDAAREFLRDAIPDLASAPIVYTRLCLYSDTWDGHPWIDRDPAREGLTVATGGSGHAFKFAPLLGGLIADVVEDIPNALRDKFRWRPDKRPRLSQEAARHQILTTDF
ncbi:MAG: FAD-dependent oxidoreductase [Chloroflexi bacterium]|nr:FAD-dependent oxidoreductase [Chloroflexota bacterium]